MSYDVNSSRLPTVVATPSYSDYGKKQKEGDILAVATSADYTAIAGGSWEDSVFLKGVKRGVADLMLRDQTSLVCALAFDKTERLLASGTTGGEVYVHDVSSGKCVFCKRICKSTEHVTSVLFFSSFLVCVAGENVYKLHLTLA